jgi:hypothetical protein
MLGNSRFLGLYLSSKTISMFPASASTILPTGAVLSGIGSLLASNYRRQVTPSYTVGASGQLPVVTDVLLGSC